MCRLLLLLVTVAGLLTAGHALAQPAEPSPEEIRTLAELLRDPAIQSWLQAQAEGAPPAEATAAASGEPGSAQQVIAGRLDAMRAFLRELAAAAPTLPGELGRTWTILSIESLERGPFGIVVLLAAFAALGFGVEWLFWWATGGFRRRMIAAGLDSAGDRVRAVGTRFLYGLGVLLAFAVGSVGAFLLFDWPPLLRQIVLGYLMVFLIVRLVLVLGRIVLAPGAERFRVLPMAAPAARFWFVWSAALIGWFFFVQATLDLLVTLGVDRPTGYLVGLACGVVLVGLTLFVVWRHPTRDGEAPASRGNRLGAALLSLYVVCVWLLLFTGTAKPFYVGVILLLLPIALRGTHLAVNHVLRPAGSDAAGDAVPSLTAVTVERGLRAVLLIGGAYLIAWVLGLDFGALTTQDTVATRLLRGAINAVAIVLLADFAWHVARAWIDCRLAEASAGVQAQGDELRRRARLRTLLPILRNVLFIVLMAMAALMALAALGVEVGPLIAGAGVVGLAIGFGAQTLVKDIISGMFFLLDDAFRVGEYIESGNIRGTVEAFSLRSIKLRHHRGALHTIPFGSLDKITNYSRDWVIDKVTVSVTYDTDLDKVKPIIKQIGKELQADPELAPHILETLKMQGVEQFGDFAIQIRLKMMTKPGEQFVIRRRAYGLIKKAFAANGIEFAFPTVTVAGGGDATTAVAQKGLDLVQPPSPAA
ncbi:MAG TPA: mechanosensitive ion channel domain-containing protein [Geminicoccaceae bacterium]|nr:mechanosensitive ion channel domain-containing protein [Geminicoccaceae bacterium]